MFKVGDRVFDIRFGWGKVCADRTGELLTYPIEVAFDNGDADSYTFDGKCIEDLDRILYHHDYTPKETQELKVSESETLTKIDQFAAMAMQGFLSGDIIMSSKEIAELSVNMADALIKALNEK